MKYHVYILWSQTIKKYYVGSTNDVNKRLEEHNAGNGKFTSRGRPWIIIKTFECLSRSEATQLENGIKKRGIKRFLIANKIISLPV